MRHVILLALLVLGGCGFTGGISTIGSQASGISGTSASIFGIPAATCAAQISAEATELQMLRAQLNGMPVTPPPLPTLR